ncbi:MAG TPA: DASS family sodium-coupled anion symporter [Actinospica sp.]|jgi:sodium-dependent dicarboxylate transporter 2/3/5|nr:DASS family sodium-coupled anion symporter [Actinospica sp.]
MESTAPAALPALDPGPGPAGAGTGQRLSLFERRRRTVGLVLAPVVLLGVLLAPLGLTSTQHKLAACLLMVVVLWVTEAVPIAVGGLVGIVMAALIGVATPKLVVAPFGSTTVMLFIGVFILARAMLVHGLARRLALRVLAVPGVGESTTRIVVAFGVITCIVSLLVSGTATVAMLLPTALGIAGIITTLMDEQGLMPADADRTRLRVNSALLLVLAYGASVGGFANPVSFPPNVIARGLIAQALHRQVTVTQWFTAALPILLLMFVVLIGVVILLVNKPEVKRIEGVRGYVLRELDELGPISRAEKNTLFAFGVTVALWLTPGVFALALGNTSSTYLAVDGHLDEGIVALIGACLLFLLPTDWRSRTFTMDWQEASKIDWGTILLFGSGIIFGSLLQSTGLAKIIGTSSAHRLGLTGLIPIMLFAILLAVLISETTSHTAAAAVIVPIVIPIALAAGVDPIIPAVAGTFGCSLGSMLPVSTPQNAIVYGSGLVPITRMIRSGACFALGGLVIITLVLPWSGKLL